MDQLIQGQELRTHRWVSAGIHNEVRWSGSNDRSSSSQETSHTRSSASPRWNRTVTFSVTGDSTASLISDRRSLFQHCATRSGPRCPAALHGEGLAVHQPEPGGYRVDSEADEGKVDERHRRVDTPDRSHRRPRPGAPAGARPSVRRRWANRGRHRPRTLEGGFDQVVHDGPVDLGEVVGPLVVTIECGRVGIASRRRMPGRPEEYRSAPGQEGVGLLR